MEYMSEEDFFEIQLGSLLSDVDRKIVMDLYQPILGSSATSLYFRLWNDAEKDGENGFYDLRQFLLCMQMSTSTLLKARKYL